MVENAYIAKSLALTFVTLLINILRDSTIYKAKIIDLFIFRIKPLITCYYIIILIIYLLYKLGR